MATEKQWVTFRGVVRGQNGETGCTVRALQVALRGGTPSSLPENIAYANFSIESTDKTLPDGDYKLTLNNEETTLKLKNGFWLGAS